MLCAKMRKLLFWKIRDLRNAPPQHSKAKHSDAEERTGQCRTGHGWAGQQDRAGHPGQRSGSEARPCKAQELPAKKALTHTYTASHTVTQAQRSHSESMYTYTQLYIYRVAGGIGSKIARNRK